MKFRKPSGLRKPGQQGKDDQTPRHSYTYPQNPQNGAYGQSAYYGYPTSSSQHGQQGYGYAGGGQWRSQELPNGWPNGGSLGPQAGSYAGGGQQGGYAGGPYPGLVQNGASAYSNNNGQQDGYPGTGFSGYSQPNSYPGTQGYTPQAGSGAYGQHPHNSGYPGQSSEGPVVRISSRQPSGSIGYQPVRQGETQPQPNFPGFTSGFMPGMQGMQGMPVQPAFGAPPMPPQAIAPAAPEPLVGEVVEASAAAADTKAGGLFSLANLSDIKGFVDRMGGIDGILSSVTKFQKVISSVQSMAPLMKLLVGSFSSKKSDDNAGSETEDTTEWRPKKRRVKRRTAKRTTPAKRRKPQQHRPSKPLRYSYRPGRRRR
ncbi:hypothetical protein [Paenibacillus protaetiae]|uniref:hypothetical protein n=1 Tax=Paenibacillus protaetiae TaxID=2509456 RepID=UPI0013E9EEA1|nr:hypothetical protein [Paenibacillus protaetiae]